MITEDNFALKFGCANFSELVFDVLYNRHRKRYDFIMSLPFRERQQSFANILGFDTMKDMQIYFDTSNSITTSIID